MKILLVIFVLPFSYPAVQLTAQQKRTLRGEVVFVKENNVQEKQKKVEIYIKETGDRDLTDNSGIFRIFLGDSLHAGERISLGINKKGWEIQYPIYGETYIPANTEKELLKVKILPISSPLFLSHDQITRFVEYSILKYSKESNKNIGEQSNKIQIDSTLKAWANRVGLTEKGVKEAFHKWLMDIYNQTSNLYEKGLAEYVKENYMLAAEMFNTSTVQKEILLNDLTEERKTLESKEKTLVNEIIRDSRLAGESFEKKKDFLSAIEQYKKAVQYMGNNSNNEILSNIFNDIGLNYNLLARQTTDFSKLNLLDSADLYVTKALQKINSPFSNDDGLILLRNQALTLIEKSFWTSTERKSENFLRALRTLNEIENKCENNIIMRASIRYNIGACFGALSGHIEDPNSASAYLDSASIYLNSINDSSTFNDFPLLFGYINMGISNLYLYKVSLIMEKSALDNWFIKYLNYFSPKSNKVFSSCLKSSNDIENYYVLNGFLKESISYAEKAITYFRNTKHDHELAHALNLLVDAKIKQLLFDNENHSFHNIPQISALLTEIQNICVTQNIEYENIFSQVLRGKIYPMEMLQANSLRIDDLIIKSNLESKRLVEKNYLPDIQLLIKENILLNYIIIIYLIDNHILRGEYLNRAEFLVDDIINTYYELSKFRRIEEFNKFKLLIGCFRNSL